MQGGVNLKYITFEAGFETCPNCYINMRMALKRIGEINPFKIKRTSIKGGIRKPETRFRERDYIKRGILNIRYVLNRNLGKSGKFSNRMIDKSSQLKRKDIEGICYLRTSIPGKDFAKIVATTYIVLWSVDPQLCLKLIQDECIDPYQPKITNKNDVFVAIAPIQTNIIVRGSTNFQKGEEIRKYLLTVTR